MSAIPHGAVRLPFTASVYMLDPALGPTAQSVGLLNVGDDILVQSQGRMCFCPVISVDVTSAPDNVCRIAAGSLGEAIPVADILVDAMQPVGRGIALSALQEAVYIVTPSEAQPGVVWALLHVGAAERIIVDQMAVASGPVAASLPVSVSRHAWTADMSSKISAFAGTKPITAEVVEPICGGASFGFAVPPRTSMVRLTSRCFAPAGEVRHLGVAVQRLTWGDANIALDSPILARGFYALEQSASAQWRWTDGDAVLILPPSHDKAILTVEITDWHVLPGG